MMEWIANTDNNFSALEIKIPGLGQLVKGLSDPNTIIYNLLSFHSLNLKTRSCHEINVASVTRPVACSSNRRRKLFADLNSL